MNLLQKIKKKANQIALKNVVYSAEDIMIDTHNELKAKYNTSAIKIQKINNEINDLHYNLCLASRKINDLTAKTINNEYTKMEKIISFIMEAKLKGVIGSLSQLGTYDKKYLKVFETVFGIKMFQIVVEDEYSAFRAIQFLKDSKIGKAMFIPLNKVPEKHIKLDLPESEGVLDFAINLIDCDNKYRNIFLHSGGDTLVVENIECAKRLIGKYNIVTLDGEFFHKSGLMLGGYILNLDAELNYYKTHIKEIKSKLKVLEKQKG